MTVADAVRRPEYTGSNRCWPCTVLNGVLLGAGALVAGAVWVPAGVGLVVAGGAAIWLRGYLVPYTPRFAPRIAELLPVGFEKEAGDGEVPEERRGSLTPASPEDADAVLERLLAAGVLTADGETVALSTAFADAWEREQDAACDLTGEDLVAAVGDAAPGDPEVTVREVDGTEWVRLAGDRDVLLSRPVAVAEVAAVEALADAAPALDAETRATAASALRAFLETCPVCRSRLVESSTADCCGGVKGEPRAVLLCPECDQRLYTFPET